MNRKIITGLLIAVVAGFLFVWIASPFVAAQGLIRAARTGDAAGLERYVDFPAFRTSLKDELNARARLEIRERSKGDVGLAGNRRCLGRPDRAVTGVGRGRQLRHASGHRRHGALGREA